MLYVCKSTNELTPPITKPQIQFGLLGRSRWRRSATLFGPSLRYFNQRKAYTDAKRKLAKLISITQIPTMECGAVVLCAALQQSEAFHCS